MGGKGGSKSDSGLGPGDIINVRLDYTTATRVLQDPNFTQNFPRLAQAIAVGIATSGGGGKKGKKGGKGKPVGQPKGQPKP
jgi:hypothetical protein